MKYVHVKLEVIAQVTEEQAEALCDPANRDLAAENLFHEHCHGEATLSVKQVRGPKDDVAGADWSEA